ncbi:hypothetical protein ACX0HA_08795 [Flavobacterium hauense]
MQLHKADIDELLSDNLPDHYSTEVVKRLGDKGLIVSADVVRNVRNGRSAKNSTRIMSELVLMANEEKAAKDNLGSLINTTK